MAGLTGSLPFMQVLHGQTVATVDECVASDARARRTFAQEVALLGLTGNHPVVVQSIPTVSTTQSFHVVHAATASSCNARASSRR
ncbi:hypothetical protein WS61_21875 [Burkholderia sp. ABCPW 11]|uniref:hypothetical protein n=1 Tax=Burkholderia sp. ABCPW 11 TaxID=1637859 RepID=UPI0007587CE3|nr:hypothetical protein [Burkholderia sp. ABCPW 11]KVD39197.1 hypothetical protein WS61_21875 [Burkholderia sp. ABCPW 11]